MHSSELKFEALSWLRYDRQHDFIATEFGNYCADVFAATQTKTTEVEVKVNLYDLRKDFNKVKHRFYLEPQKYLGDWRGHFIPSYFFFMVPASLSEEAAELCRVHNNHYGVLTFDPLAEYGKKYVVTKRCKRIHEKETNQGVLSALARRMSTELLVALEFKKEMIVIQQRLCEQARKDAGVPTRWPHEFDLEERERNESGTHTAG